MHRIRSLLMRDRIAQINQIRGLLAEYGVVIALDVAAWLDAHGR
ncbi:transposase [Paraburkholderia sp. JPY171]|nr:transposase [Paraburkholderia atlantica]